jgi:Domain of unknown function (DUF4351)
MLAESIDRWNREIREEGRQEGRQEGEARVVLRLLRLKFGPLEPEIEDRVRSADADRGPYGMDPTSARAFKMSRNRLIVQALEFMQGSDWSPGFFEQLSAIDSDTVAAVDELLASVREARTSKPPRSL